MASLIQLVTEAWRIRTFNRALGLHETDLTRWPVDFVEAVLIWGPRMELPRGE